MSPFSNFTPGLISEELLEALEVPKNGIPLHVYYMRETGYPNGWLEEAREEYSGISIFTAPNKCNSLLIYFMYYIPVVPKFSVHGN